MIPVDYGSLPGKIVNSKKEYLLWKTFMYQKTIDMNNDANSQHTYKYVGSYKGKMFCSPQKLNDFPWFSDYHKAMAYFAGMSEISDEEYISELTKFL